MVLKSWSIGHGKWFDRGFCWQINPAINGGYHGIVRYDSAHNCPHKDTLDIHGKVIRKVWFEWLDNRQGLNLAIKDLKDNYQFYADRFKKWLAE